MIWKLRSMRVNAESATGPVWAVQGHDRRSRIGTFLPAAPRRGCGAHGLLTGGSGARGGDPEPRRVLPSAGGTRWRGEFRETAGSGGEHLAEVLRLPRRFRVGD
ncbi:MAG: hypothetical protein GY953_16860 [bacterium]|nr:hypothetical protein [bacterium]